MEGSIAIRPAARQNGELASLELKRKNTPAKVSIPEPEIEARTGLALAQQERDAHRANRDRLAEAVERVGDVIVAIEGKLAEFADVDMAIAEECAALILRSIDNDEDPKLEFSPELAKISDEKFSFANQLAAARQAQERLRREFVVTEKNLSESERLVERAAIAVAACEIEPIAAELGEIEGRAATLRRLLLGYGALRYTGGFLPMSRTAALLLRGIRDTHDPEALARWRSHLAELSVDNEAALDVGFFS